jgi:hypothetical protein
MVIAALLAFQSSMMPAVSPAVAQLEPVAAAAEPAKAESVASLVGGIISYSRWPTPPRPVRLCLAGSTRHALRISDAQRTAGQSLMIRAVAAGATPAGCDVLYLGTMRVAARAKMLAATRGKPVVSIIEDDLHCRTGAMFCLIPARGTFRLNLDAVSRSQVRIDPRVLRIASGEEERG